MAVKWIVVLAALIGLLVALTAFRLTFGTKPLPWSARLFLLMSAWFIYTSVILAGFLIEHKEILGTREYFVSLAKSFVLGLLMTTAMVLVVFVERKFLNEKFSWNWAGVIFIFLLLSATPLNGIWNPLKHSKITIAQSEQTKTPH